MSSVVQTKSDTLDLLRIHRDEILSLGVSRLGLFGSFVREQQQTDSDVDLLVEFKPGQKRLTTSCIFHFSSKIY